MKISGIGVGSLPSNVKAGRVSQRETKPAQLSPKELSQLQKLNATTLIDKPQGKALNEARLFSQSSTSPGSLGSIYQVASNQRTIEAREMGQLVEQGTLLNALNRAQFDATSSQLERLDMSQIQLLLDPNRSTQELQEALGLSSIAIRQAQEALGRLGLQDARQAVELTQAFFKAGQNTAQTQHMGGKTPENLDRNWGHLYSGEKRIHRFFFNAFGLSREAPTMNIPFGTSRTVQPDGQFEYRAPLMGNQAMMLKGMIQPERLLGLGILASWRYLSNWTAERFGDRHVNIFGVEVEVEPVTEVYTDFSALNEEPDKDTAEAFQRHMLNYGKDTIRLKSKLHDSHGNVVAYVTTKFAVMLAQAGQQKAGETQEEQTAMGQDSPLLSHGKRPKLSLRKLLKSLIHRRGADVE